MDFDSTIDEDMSAFDDFAWIQVRPPSNERRSCSLCARFSSLVPRWTYQTADKNLFVVASATDFKLALVDMSEDEPTVEYIALSDKTFGEDDRLRDRQVEWAQGR